MIDFVPPIAVFKGVFSVPDDLLAWAEPLALAHEEEWGFDEDVAISGSFAGWRGAVPAHTDFDFMRDHIIGGIILKATDQWLIAEGIPPSGHLKLEPGDLYLLEPSTMHGTRSTSDDLFLFVTGTFSRDVLRDVTPTEAAAVLMDSLMDEKRYLQRVAEQKRVTDQACVYAPMG